MKKKYSITITNKIIVEFDDNETSLGDFITEMDDTIKSRTEGAVILEQHLIDCDDEEIK
jgi:hypothetical protein